MFNIGGGELLIIFLVALVVLGPTKLPEAARQAGKIIGEFRRVSSGFQREIQAAMNDPVSKVTGEATPRTLKDVTTVAEVPPIPDDESPAEFASKKPFSNQRTTTSNSAPALRADSDDITSADDDTSAAEAQEPANADVAGPPDAAPDDTAPDTTAPDGGQEDVRSSSEEDPPEAPVMYGDR